jgi:RNA polymerase sigma-70 factor (ECF subfamily)
MRAEEADFRELVEQHQSMVFSIALRILGDRGAAEEVAQDVFLELHGSLGRLESEEHIRFWLRRIAAHRSTDYLRRRLLRPEFRAEEWTEQHDSGRDGRSAGEGAVGTRLEQMLLSLPNGLRAAIVLRYQEDLTPNEIAKTLEQPLATVKSNLQRGLEMLRRKAGAMLKEYVRER